MTEKNLSKEAEFMREMLAVIENYAPGSFKAEPKSLVLTSSILAALLSTVLLGIKTHSPGTQEEKDNNMKFAFSYFSKDLDMYMNKIQYEL